MTLSLSGVDSARTVVPPLAFVVDYTQTSQRLDPDSS